MSFDPGGYADKLGNRYEVRWTVRQLLRLVSERLRSVTVESVGGDEQGIDLWIERLDGKRVGQQCKAQNGRKGEWTIADLAAAGILGNCRFQLERDCTHEFELISATPAPRLIELARSARHSIGDPETFYQHQILSLGKERQQSFQSYCDKLDLDSTSTSDRALAFDHLRRTGFNYFAVDDDSLEDLRAYAKQVVNADPDTVIAVLAKYVSENLRKRLVATDIHKCLIDHNLQIRALIADPRVGVRMEELRTEFFDSIESGLIAGNLISRIESDRIQQLLCEDEPPAAILITGSPGSGKTGVLYQLASDMYKVGTPFIAVRLDRKEIHGSACQFGKDLGLPDSPVKCLADIAGTRSAVLILDQLDALRWTSAHAYTGLEVCKELLRQVRACRIAGSQVTVILCCRTSDVENDESLKRWLKPDGNMQFKEVEVTTLPDEVVRGAVRAAGVDPSELMNRRVTLLSNALLLRMWCDLARTNGRTFEFDTATQLMRGFWRDRCQRLERAGVSATEREQAVYRLVDAMEQSCSLSAPLRLVEQNQTLLTELQTLGVITVSGKVVTFSHQSYLDFLVADRIVRTLDLEKSFQEWIGDKSKQSLFRREQLRQVLFMLADEDQGQFICTLSYLLDSADIRFHMQQLALEAVREIYPFDSLVEYCCGLLENDRWREHVVNQVFWKNSPLVSALIDRRLMDDWLTSGESADEDRALWLLGSVSSEIGCEVAKVYSSLLSRADGWAARIRDRMTSEVGLDSEGMFSVRVDCVRRGAGPHFVGWKGIVESHAERAIILLAELLEHGTKESDRRVRHDPALTLDSSDEFRAIVRAAAIHSELTFSRLLPLLVSLAVRRREQLRRRGYVAYDERIRIPPILISAVRAAICAIAKQSPEKFISIASVLDLHDSRVVRRLLVAGYSVLPSKFADSACEWIVSDTRRLRCGCRSRTPQWEPAVRLIRRHSPFCSDRVFSLLESVLLRYRDPDEKRMMRHWLRYRRRGDYRDEILAGQFHLLPALDGSRRSLETISRIGVLRCRYEGVSPERFLSPRSKGGWVVSSLESDRLGRFSDKTWLGIILRGSESFGTDSWESKKYLRDCVVESSVEMFSRSFRAAASRDPERFVRLGLQIPGSAPPEYLAEVLHVAGLVCAPSDVSGDIKDGWRPASAAAVDELLNHAALCSDEYHAKNFLWVIIHRDDVSLSPRVIERLRAYVRHRDPSPRELHIDCNQDSAECSVEVLRNNTINCVRGLVAIAIANVLLRKPEMLSEFSEEITSLASDQSPVVRLAATEICRPLWNIEPRKCISYFLLCCENDERITVGDFALSLYNRAFPSWFDDVSPLVRKMIHSSRSEVVKVGAAQVCARWLFHGFFGDEFKECAAGTDVQREGVVKAASRLVREGESGAAAADVLVGFFDDPCESVREQSSRFLDYEGVLEISHVREIMNTYMVSKAFRDNPARVINALRRHRGSMLQLVDVLKLVCTEFVSNLAEWRRSPPQHGLYAGADISPQLLRLYEEADSSGHAEIRDFCLDMWDLLLEYQVGSTKALTRSLDQ